MFKEIYKHLSRKRKKQLLILLFLTIFASISELISIVIVLPFLNAVTNLKSLYGMKYLKQYFDIDNTNSALLFITFSFCLITIFTGIIRLLLIWYQNKLSQVIGADFSAKIFKNTLHQPYLIQISRNSSDIISGVLNKSNSIVNSAILPFFVIFSSISIFIMILTTLLILNPIISLIIIFSFILIYLFIIKIFKNKVVNLGNLINTKQPIVLKVLQEGLGGIRDILIDGTQNVYYEIYRKADADVRKSQADLILIGQAPRYLLETLGMTLIALIAYFIAKNSNGTANVTVILGGFAIGALRLLPVLQQFYASWTNLKSGQQPCKDALKLLDQPLPEYLKNKDSIKPINFTNSIIFKDISFKYPNNNPLILDNLNFKIEKGNCIGIIGTTGCGKSTLLDILMSLLLPTNGNIIVDQTPITNLNYRSWQMQIAHVPQSIFLSDSTIAENIAFGVPLNNIDLIKVKDAAKRAKISNVIEDMEDGYNTIVGERGVRLSGGQRQRIGIARALYKSASVLVLDEATSALDGETEIEIMNSLNNLNSNLTIFIVAHRLTTLKSCDKIIELEHGRIKNILTYNQIKQ
jgi:ABC-type multidrug transport system fused ATPase/permease subunit